MHPRVLNQSFVPGEAYGHAISYGIPTSLVVSLYPMELSPEDERVCRELEQLYHNRSRGYHNPHICYMNIHAFGGTALAMGRLISKLRRSSPYTPTPTSTPTFTSTSSTDLIGINNYMKQRLKVILVQYIIHHYASLDIHSQYFRFGYARSNLSYTYMNSVIIEQPSTSIPTSTSTSSTSSCRCRRDNAVHLFKGSEEYIHVKRGQIKEGACYKIFPPITRNLEDYVEIPPNRIFPRKNRYAASFQEVDYGMELPNLLGSGTGSTIEIEYEVLQVSYVQVVKYFNTNKWIAAMIRNLYTLDVLTHAVSNDIHSNSVLAEKLLQEIQKVLYVPIYNSFQCKYNVMLFA